MISALDTVASVVDALYDALSFAGGSQPNYALVRAIFHPQARITPPAEDTAGSLSPMAVDDYIEIFHKRLVEDGITDQGGRELEIHRHTLTFNRVAHVFSSYQFVLLGASKPLVSGVNTIQLVYENERWWILSLSWDRAREGQSLIFQ